MLLWLGRSELIIERNLHTVPKMPTCRSCHEPVNAGDRFCGECGCQNPAAGGTCPQCGTAHKRNVKFCGECGAAMTGAPAATQPAAAPVRYPDRPGYFWPDSLGGSLFYVAVIASCAFAGYFLTKQIALEEPQLELEGREYIGSAVSAVGGYLLLLLLRSACITFGVFSKPHAGPVAAGSGKASGGMSVAGIILMLFAVGLTRKCVLDSVKKQQQQRQFEKWKEKSLRRRPNRPRTITPRVPRPERGSGR